MGQRPAAAEGSGRYEVRVRGHLDDRWTTWFDGLTLTAAEDGTTVLEGPIVDQAALHGVLRRLADLGLTLISVTPVVIDQPTDPADETH
jgi:hypothetical protein